MTFMKVSLIFICIASLICCSGNDTRETSESARVFYSNPDFFKKPKQYANPFETIGTLILFLSCSIFIFPIAIAFFGLIKFLTSLGEKKE